MGDRAAIPSGPIVAVSEASLRLLGATRGVDLPVRPECDLPPRSRTIGTGCAKGGYS
jgi:hypothetical protein